MQQRLRSAHSELGLDFPSTPGLIRAAYLKLLKTRKPDRDPDGFRRLRDAYEFLKNFTESQLEVAEPAAPSQLSAEASLQAEVAPERSPEEQLATTKRSVAGVIERLRGEPFSVMERIRILDRVQQAFPQDDDLAEWLALALMEAALDDEAARLLRDSIKGRQGAGAVRLWRLMYSRLAGHMGRYSLLNPPGAIELRERLEIST